MGEMIMYFKVKSFEWNICVCVVDFQAAEEKM